jgi:type I restriction enzyme S subunit
MSKLNDLINKLCPDGVKFKTLGEIGEFKNNGVDKKIMAGQKPIMLLNFVDVFRNMYLHQSTPTMRVTASDAQIENCSVLKGDIFVTPSSEIINEIGRAAVVKEDILGCVYSYHIARIRLFDKSKVLPEFIRYLFECEIIQRQINRSATGITRFGLTKGKWESLKFPIPPLPVQEEIVRILDKFTELQAELTAELTARKKQYEHYRNSLLNFGKNDGQFFDPILSEGGGNLQDKRDGRH